MKEIAICDNDAPDLQILTGFTEEYLSEHPGVDGHICAFQSAPALKGALERGEKYCVFLLDIVMPGIDGIEMGKAIRALDSDVPVIYTTSAEEYALGAFQNHAIRYLVKPVERAELFSALDLAFALVSAREGRRYTVRSKDGIVSLSGRDIVAVENRSRAAIYSLRDGSMVKSVSLRGAFEDSVRPLPEDPDFMRPHKSYFVNMRYICSLRAGSLTLDDGREIPVSRGCYADANRTYLNFLAQEGEDLP